MPPTAPLHPPPPPLINLLIGHAHTLAVNLALIGHSQHTGCQPTWCKTIQKQWSQILGQWVNSDKRSMHHVNWTCLRGELEKIQICSPKNEGVIN